MAPDEVSAGRDENIKPSTDNEIDFGSPTPLPKRRSSDTNEKTGSGALTPPKYKDMALTDPQPRCLFFDVFGTCVDWRKTVTDELWRQTREALNSPAASIASRIRMAASDMVRPP